MEKTAEQLVVTLGDRRIGILRREKGGLAFVYNLPWLDDPCSHPLSLSLPLRKAPFADIETRAWFGNLLPEGDFCQALGVEANLKYEESGGPGLSAIWHLLRNHSSAPAVDGRQLLRWIAFNFLIGNADAHGKNLALLYDETGSVRLAPFYDLLCTNVYPQLDQRMAMRLGGERRPDRLRRKHWERLAEDLGIAPRAVFGELANLTQTIESTAEALAGEFNARYDCGETMNAILATIRRRRGRAWAFLGGRQD